MKGHISTLMAAFLLLESAVSGLKPGETCTTPDSVRGTCIGVRECPSFVLALRTKPIPQEKLDFLRQSQCGFQNKDPLVCCPSSSSSTPNQPPPPGGVEVTEDVSGHRNLNLLPLEHCGPIADNRLIGRNRTYLNELPWMALVAYSVPSGSPYRCGGTVINNRYILTAAHCAKLIPSNLHPTSVRLGEHDLDSEIDCEDDPFTDEKICAPAPQDIPIEEIVAHPSYADKADLQYDIALLRLSRPANITSDAVRPICLPIGLPEQTRNLDGVRAILSGWGVTENGTASSVLQRMLVRVMPQQQCEAAFGGTVPISSASQICADEAKGGDSCFGDSGGPLTYFGEVESIIKTVQYGVVSYGPGNCGSPGLPGVYTRVGHFMKWILDNIKP